MIEPLFAANPEQRPAPEPIARHPMPTNRRSVFEPTDRRGQRPGGFAKLLFSGIKAILLMPVRPGTVSSGAGACTMLVLLLTTIGIIGERWLLGSEGLQFNWTGLRAAWFDLPILLLGGAWMAQRASSDDTQHTENGAASARARPPLLHFTAVTLSAAVWIVLLAYALFAAQRLALLPPPLDSMGDQLVVWIYMIAPVWSLLVAIRTVGTMHRFAPITVLRRLVVLFVLAAAAAWAIIDPIEPYWISPEAQEPDIYVGSGKRARMEYADFPPFWQPIAIGSGGRARLRDIEARRAGCRC